jgi:acyl carrier protein
MNTSYTKEIRDFIVSNFLFGEGAGLQDDQSFLDGGIVDSTGMLELIMFLETTFQIKISPDEMVPENLDSVNRVAGFVGKKKLQEAATK